MKKKLLSLFTIILSACAIGFISTIGLFNTNAKAAEAQVEFEMLGASLRLGIDYNDDSTGLRFAAQVDKSVSAQVAGDANKTFGGVIVPANLLYADAETSRPAYKAGENIFDYMSTYHPTITLAYKDGLTVGSRDGYDIVALSLTNVANKNLARDFFGVIYIKEGSNYTFASGNAIKSVHYVATATVADTEAYLTEEQYPVALDMAKQAGYVANQGAANVENGTDLSSVVASMELASFYDFEANEWNETTLEYAYAKTGKVNYDVIIRNDKYGTEEETVFNAYREYSVDVEDRKYITVDKETGEISITDGAFNGITEDSLTVNVKMHVFDAIIDVPVTITNNVDTIAAEVSAKLAQAALTTVENAYDGIDLYTARFAYEELSAAGKRAVDETSLAAFQAKEAEYAQNFSIISGPLDYSKTIYVGGDLAVNEFVEDSTYGLVYEMKYNDNPGNGYVLVKLYAEEAFASGKKVYISIFNGGDEDATVLYLKDNAYWTKSDIVVPAGQWKEVMIDSGLLSGDTIGLATTDAPGMSYKFTMMYTMSDAYVAGQINDIIAELPETIEGHKYGPIAEAKRLYALLSEEGKALVTDWATLEAKDAQYAEQYQSILVMDDSAMFYQDVNSFGDIATWAYDTNSTYGNVIVGTGHANLPDVIPGEHSNSAVIKSNIALPDLSIAKTVNIWVYKSTDGRFNIRQNNNWNTMHKVTANTWTLISFPANEFKAFYMGFWDTRAGDTIMFSNIWAETYMPEIRAMEAQIAALTGDDADAIVDAFDVYNALPTGVQNAVSNKDVLLGYVDTFNNTLINRAIDSINLIPASPAGNQYGLILAAKDAYNKVPNALRSQVTNYSNIAKAETAWKNSYALVVPMQEGSLTEISATYGTGIHTFSYEVIETYGKVMKADVQTAGTLAFSYSAQSNMAGIKSVVFTIYNGSNTACPLDSWKSGGATGGGDSLAIGWNTVEIAMDENYKGITTSDAGDGYTNYNGKFGIWNATPGTWYIASVYFNTYWADVNDVQSMIDALDPMAGDEDAINAARDAYNALPDEMKEYVNTANLEECENSLGDVRVQAVINLIDELPEIIAPYDILKIEKARARYDALSDTDKALVTNAADLEAVEADYAKYYVLGASASGYVDVTDWTSGDVTLGSEQDETYGALHTATFKTLGRDGTIGFKTGAAATVKDYDKAVIYIYNGGTQNAYAMQLIGGGWTKLDVFLVAGEWTKVEFDPANFDENYVLGAINVTETGVTFKFSSMWLYTDAYASEMSEIVKIQEAIALIDAIPETINEFSHVAIENARAAVNAVSEAGQAQITNLADLEAAEASYNAYYVLVEEVNSYTDKTVDNVSGASLVSSIENDPVYGEVFVETVKEDNSTTRTDIILSTTKDTLNTYSEIVVYIYNGGDAVVYAAQNNASCGIALAPGEWTKVVYQGSKFTTQYIGIWGPQAGVVYKFSSAFAYTEAYNDLQAQEKVQKAIAAIDSLPEAIDAYTYYDIQAVQAVVDSLPEQYLESVTNLADFEAYKAQYNANYLMVRDWNNLDGVTNISGVYKAGTTQAFSVVEDETYGKLLKVEHNADNAEGQAAVWAIDYTALTTTLPEGWVLTFTVYNGGSKTHAIDICQGGDVTGNTYVNAPAGAWTIAEINAENYTFFSATNGRFDVWAATNGTYYLASIYAVNPELLEGEAIRAAIDAIDAIPETLEGQDYGYILVAQDAVNAVSEVGQAQITNLADLEAADNSYKATYVPVLPIHSSYSFNQDLTVGGDRASYNIVLDQDYGYVLQGEVHTDGAAVIKLPSGSAPDLTMSTTVYVWVYKSGTDGAFRPHQSGSWDTIVNVPADTWTLVEIPASEYYFGRFGMWNSKVGETVKFSMFWADSVAEQVNAAIEAIDALPETIKEYDLEKIQAAREVVNELPEAFINSNYIPNIADLEAAEKYYATYYVLVADTTVLVDKTNNNVMGGATVSGTEFDSVYGEVTTITVNDGKNPPRIDVNLNADLTNYEQVSVYIYNGGTTVVSALQHTSATQVSVVELPVGEWTKVVYDVEAFTDGKLMGVIGTINAGSVYKFSAIYSYTEDYALLESQEAIETAEAVIDLIPETLEGYHYNYILDAENAINAVPEKYQGYIENINVYNAAVEQYNTYYVAVLPIMTADKYTEDVGNWGVSSTATIVEDATYGKVLSRSINSTTSSKGPQVNFYPGGITADLSGVSKVSIYVYKTTAGRFNASTDWATMISVPANTWTRIELDVATLRTDAFGMWDCVIGETVKYTMMWVDKPTKLAQTAIAQIEELPDGNSEFDYIEIEAARATVDALSAEVLEHVTNLSKLENAEATYASLYMLANTADKYTKNNWTGDYTAGTQEVEDYGLVYTATMTTLNSVPALGGASAIPIATNIEEASCEYSAAAIYIYNGGITDVNFLILNAGGSWTNTGKVISAGEWTRIQFETVFYDGKIILGVCGNIEKDATYMFTAVFGLSEYGMAKADIDAANEALSNMPTSINPYSVYELNELRAIVDVVPEAYKTSEYLPELAAFEALEAEYAESYVVVRTWDDTTGINNRSANSGDPDATQTFSIVEDPTYGKVLKIEHDASATSKQFGSIAIQYTAATTDMTSATKLIFVGYNGGTNAHAFDIAEGGSFSGIGYAGNAPVGQWFTVEIDVANYKFYNETEGRIGFWYATSGTYYIAAIIAESAQASINRAIRAINALPEDITGESAGLIATARAAVNEVPAESQAQITNLAVLEAAEAQFALDYAIVSTVDTYVYDANMGGTPANVQVVNTPEYGNVFKYNKVTTGGVVYKFTPSVTITNYAKLYFAVRLSASANIGLNVGGWNTDYQVVAANEWTIVEVTAADLSSTAIGVWGGAANMTIEISAVWAITELPQDNVDQEDPFN